MRLGQGPPGIFQQDTKDMCFEMDRVGMTPGDKGCGPCLQGNCTPFRKDGRANRDSKLAYHHCCRFPRRMPRFYRRYSCTLLMRVKMISKKIALVCPCIYLPGGHELQELAPAGEFKPSGHSSQEAICVSSALE